MKPVDGRVSWSELHTGSDLFSWFHLTETGRRVGDDLTWISVAPEALGQVVRLRFGIDRADIVVSFQLAIDREWLDGTPTAMPNAGDLAKSVVEASVRGNPTLALVAQGLMAGAFRASRSPVIIRGTPEEPTGHPDIGPLVDVLTVADAPPAMLRAGWVLSAQNVSSADRLWFVLSWGAPTEPPDRW
jgi:hypothetical protein